MQFTANSLEQHWMPFTGNRDFKESPRIIVKGEGVYLTDHKGGTILDGSSGLFCCPLGHGRKEIAEAVYQQLLNNDYASPFQTSTPGTFELAQKVARITPDPINHVFFVNSGSESIDTALKMCMAYHRARGDGHRTRFVSRERAYHGVNIGGVSLAGMVKNRETFTSVMPNVVCMRHTWNPDELFVRGQPESGVELADDLARFCETYGGSTIAAVFVEPIAGSTGVLVPPKGYLNRLREICDEHGILLVFDEVITGFGRLGAPFASQAFDVIPDIMTMAKAITNGCQPMGAVAAKDEIYTTITEASPENAIEFFHGYTYSGHPAACAAGNAVQDIYVAEDSFQKSADLSEYFLDGLFSLRDIESVKDIRGYGLLGGVEMHPKGGPGARGTQAQKDMFWNGMHIKFTGDTACVAPPFIAEKTHIDELVDKLRMTLENA
ncbi:MAG: aspartate aminotransferase family protein [Rhodospirillaceae bacterium]|jgi:beta-alanine--pyruvate transaminase|nr:aspartate aminotransferase family protein [Rhodospirillaceae bacterium]MBT5300128.1 aspartate aminotransferase family protein [Rhodospirillaceae bacterium]MBT5512579.1 aspartate aminotransferase family protein [Rhodospirillaceae bacterium]MBT6085742.1 aspartate aminotransferase family protein [Rhodospirillaceae bacterium]MBT6606893.1 aspartate aminotransferase family protein [Rhodospirillaceae bacterium]